MFFVICDIPASVISPGAMIKEANMSMTPREYGRRIEEVREAKKNGSGAYTGLQLALARDVAAELRETFGRGSKNKYAGGVS